MRHGSRFKDLKSKVFGKLRVLAFAGMDKHGTSTWKCLCACGTSTVVRGDSLHSRNTTSCGCYQRERAARDMRNKSITHGYSRSPIYRTWKAMKTRCTNPNDTSWEWYGGRGIRVCSRWLNSFRAFLEDLGPRPRTKTLDRINPQGHYVPSNCRWSTRKTQSNNSRKRHSKSGRVMRFVDVE